MTTDTTAREAAKRVVQIIEGAGLDWSVNLTRLVDGVSEYTLTYHGERSVHPDTEEAYGRLRELQAAEKSAAVLEYVESIRLAAIEEQREEEAEALAVQYAQARATAIEECAKVAEQTTSCAITNYVHGKAIATAIRNLSGEKA